MRAVVITISTKITDDRKVRAFYSKYKPQIPNSPTKLEDKLLEELMKEKQVKRSPSTDQEPWAPFNSRLDFEVSEFAQDAMLNKTQTDTLISLIRRCADNITSFTINGFGDMSRQWDLASKKCTEVAVPYKSEDQLFEMHGRPLWDWALDIIRDAFSLAFLSFGMPRKPSDTDGTNFIRFISEPWTADAFWNIQSKLPRHKDAKLCPYIIYADKSKLSSFGTQKGYPVIARLANMVVSIRNTTDWGGGQIVGWLPVVEDDTAQNPQTRMGQFKNAVWHKSFYVLIESITAHSKTGIWTVCGDSIQRWLFPVILILASDYEEAATMALIRGVRGLYPCPVCLIKSDEQSDHNVTAVLRTATATQQLVASGRMLKSSEARESLLKSQSLRDVDNVFWNIANSDPYRALSFDRLHAHVGGLWGDHLFSEIKAHANQIVRGGAKIDQQYVMSLLELPPLKSVTNITFNDGSKHEDIAKTMVYAAHNVLTDKLGLLLLQAVRSYVELDMYASLKLHTTGTIAAGRRELQKFGDLMKEYIAACQGTDFEAKNWDFPKMHSHQHLFDDIENKGAALNFGTKIDEAMHGSARNTYLRQTNFKDVAPQILKADHRRMVGKAIRAQINDLEGLMFDDDNDNEDIPEDLDKAESNVFVGSKRRVITFSALEAEMEKDTAFHNFRTRFSRYLSHFLQVYEYGLPEGKLVNLQPHNEIIPFQFLKVFFESLDNWEDESDYLRCSPNFHNHPIYDAAIVKTVGGTIFARLIYIFTCTVNNVVHPFALINTLDAGPGQRSQRDKALGLHRVRAKPRRDSEFIPVRSIIRGALLAPDSDNPGDFFVVDLVDTDMFLRLKTMYPGIHA
ncbi:hypothetical protein C8J57DRAFT_1622209 [Mycena rebaudengoi]|nr:hypothetical protein C8J57DRAFT_1622209 [Mycena rebaudengoi]